MKKLPPQNAVRTSEKTEAAFWSRVDKGAEGECWLWKAGANQRGYGVLRVRGRNTYAHRFVHELIRGAPLLADDWVLHRCDTPRCVNPQHHFLGNAQDNRADCVNKGRHARGKKLPFSKLNAELVREIRTSPLSAAALAAKLNVHKNSIRNVRRGLTWQHVKGEG